MGILGESSATQATDFLTDRTASDVSGSRWRIATVHSVHEESPRVKLFRLTLPDHRPFRAGQYYDVRLTAPDGYQAQRSYSISSSPSEQGIVELLIEHIEGGEVSSYFHEEIEPGERIELRGPIGGHFTWTPEYTDPVLLIGGGSGIAPLMSLIRQRNSHQMHSPCLLMFSARTQQDILFRKDLEQFAANNPEFTMVITLTRETGPGWAGDSGRIDRNMIDQAISAVGVRPARSYVCGGTGFVESIASTLMEIGMKYGDIRTERFGP